MSFEGISYILGGQVSFFGELMLTLLVMGFGCFLLYGSYQVFFFLAKGVKRKELSSLEVIVLVILAVILGNMVMSLAIKG